MPLLAIDPSLGREMINAMRHEALTLKALTQHLPLRSWLDQFVDECTANLPTHKCWLDEDDNETIIMEGIYDGWKHIFINVEFDFEGSDDQVCYACVKPYEMKDKKEPASYNQSPPGGLYKNYPYLYRSKISKETWLDLTKLWIKVYNMKRDRKEKETKEQGDDADGS
jgi:hypothetical protein